MPGWESFDPFCLPLPIPNLRCVETGEFHRHPARTRSAFPAQRALAFKSYIVHRTSYMGAASASVVHRT